MKNITELRIFILSEVIHLFKASEVGFIPSDGSGDSDRISVSSEHMAWLIKNVIGCSICP